MIKNNKKKLIISSIIILLPILVGAIIWDYLPKEIAIHWNMDGESDGFSGRIFAIFGIPIIVFIIHWILVFFTVHDPKNKEQSSKVFNMVLWFLPIISLIVSGFIYGIALGYDISIDIMVRVLLGFMFLVLGNYMPKCKQNHTIGVKVKWTLKNEENWNKTHRFAGRLWVFGGVIILSTMLVPMDNIMNVFFVLILFIAFGPIIYSYAYYRKQLNSAKK